MNKELLHSHCLNLVEDKITLIKNAIKQAQEAANNETKSTAGDKHETGKAMAQLETEKLSNQLTKTDKLKDVLNRIDSKFNSSKIGLGSLIKTNKGLFYIAVGLGKVLIDEQTVFVISPLSPIGKVFMNKSQKDSFQFNGTKYTIEEII